MTAAGPHGGDEDAKRLSIPITDLARVHGVAVDVLVALTLVTTYVLVRSRAPRACSTPRRSRSRAMVAQGVLGYVQYAKAIPPVLVGFHVFGAVLVFGAVQQLLLTTTAPLGEYSEVGIGNRIGGHFPDELGSYRETSSSGKWPPMPSPDPHLAVLPRGAVMVRSSCCTAPNTSTAPNTWKPTSTDGIALAYWM